MQNITYPSKDNKNTIHPCVWKPQGAPKGVVQIIHGMAEYAERYAPLADFLTKNGFVVCAEDHLGHGQTAASKEDLGYFNDKKDYKVVLEDIHSLQEIMQKEYSSLPYFVLGHSMGSFFCRNYIAKYGKSLNGVIVMGTGYKDKLTLAAAKIATRLNALFCGWRNRSRLITGLAFGSYNKRFKPVGSPNAWVSKNPENVKAYDADPLCGFTFTNNGYYVLFSVIGAACGKRAVTSVPKDLPVYFVAGQDDPVGSYGKAVTKTYKKFKKAGIENVSITLYPEARHEILNDISRNKVMKDILQFINVNIKKG